jgi:hypothetical protein
MSIAWATRDRHDDAIRIRADEIERDDRDCGQRLRQRWVRCQVGVARRVALPSRAL